MKQLPALLVVLLCGFTSHAAENVPPTGVRRLLIVCGHPGDETYRQQFAETTNRLVAALTSNWGFASGQVTVLFGSPQMLTDGGAVPAQVNGPATLERIGESVRHLEKDLKPDDALWIVLLGHSYFDGRNSWWNLPGPDPNQQELSQLFQRLHCRECVIWMTTSVSGYFVKPLSQQQRVVIAATDAAPEMEATLFAEVMADIFAEPPALPEFDEDQNGSLSLLDLYVAICRRIAQRYVDEKLLITEHAQIDDNGDGRGREVQQYFLTEELGGRLRPGTRPALRDGQVDGARASTIPLTYIPKKNPPEDSEKPSRKASE
jgi:hypothetical protein